MKKIFPVIVILSAALLLGGCVSYDDMIPKELGEPEGLWLYRGAERMRTDGSEAEPLFDEIVLDGETYTSEEYKVYGYLYCTDAKTAFFVVGMGFEHYLCIYNYAEKEFVWSGGHIQRYGQLSSSDSYVCLTNGSDGSKSLFTRSGELVCEDMGEAGEYDRAYAFEQDILWRYVWPGTGETVLEWWKAGELHAVTLEDREGGLTFRYDGEFLYVYRDSGAHVIHSETEEMEYLEDVSPSYDSSEEFEFDRLTCGEYTFWVGCRHFGWSNGGTCYYLFRSDGSKTEIMQYDFGPFMAPVINYHFYDDICEF